MSARLSPDTSSLKTWNAKREGRPKDAFGGLISGVGDSVSISPRAISNLNFQVFVRTLELNVDPLITSLVRIVLAEALGMCAGTDVCPTAAGKLNRPGDPSNCKAYPGKVHT